MGRDPALALPAGTPRPDHANGWHTTGLTTAGNPHHGPDHGRRGNTPNAFVDLVEEVRDVLGSSSIGPWQDASEDMYRAASYLTDALTSPDGDQRSLLAWARTHLRDGIATAS